jgi:hypothetical protein
MRISAKLPGQPENPATLCGVIDRMLDEFETELRQ